MSFFKKLFFLIIILFAFSSDGITQDSIFLDNPSFEDFPRRGGDYYLSIKGWYDCGLNGFPGETPPDIHPVPKAAWEVDMKPHDGRTFLGLVIRYNKTWESLSQKLKAPLESGKCYSISVSLARSPLYKSHTTRSDEIENFIHPAVLQIWGGDELCSKKQLLVQSAPVENSEWEMKEFTFSPNEDFKIITIQAFYADGNPKAYNGHILVDNFSPIVEIQCK